MWITIVLAVSIVVFLFFLPNIAKNYIEEHDQELIGREIEIDRLSINYFTMTVRFHGFLMREKKISDAFVSFDLLEVNLNPWSLFKHTIHIEEIKLNKLYAQVLQDGSHFNFDDLMVSNDTDTLTVEEDSEPWHIVIENLDFRKGSLAYESDFQPRLQFDSIRIVSPLISDTSVIMLADVSLDISTGGRMVFKNKINTAATTYDVLIDADELSLEMIKPYLDAVLKVSEFSGFVNADFGIQGNWSDDNVFNLGGDLAIHDFVMKDEREQTVFSLQQCDVGIDSIRMADAFYNIDHVRLDGLYGLYEIYKESDNITQMLVDTTSAPSESDSTAVILEESFVVDPANPFSLLAYYIKQIAASYSESSYKVEEISVVNSSFDFNDYTTTAPFRYAFTNLMLSADSLNSGNESLTFNAGADLNGTGRFEGYIRPYTHNLQDIDMRYEIRGAELTPFSPYTGDYVDYPIVSGDLLYVNDTKIKDGIIVSENILDCNQFEFGDRVDGDAPYNLPVKLAVSILRDLDGNIHIDIPVEGDLHDPKFKLIKVIWQVLKNIVVKAVTAPFRLLANQFGVDEESLKEINFGLLSLKLNEGQEKQLNNLAKVISEKEELNIEFKRVTKKYEAVERYAINETRYRYLYKTDEVPDIEEVTQEQFDAMAKIELNDPDFILFVNEKIDAIDQGLPMQKKCLLYVGEEHAIAKTDRLGTIRAQAIEDYLVMGKQIPSERIRFKVLPEDSLITNRNNTVYNVGFWVVE